MAWRWLSSIVAFDVIVMLWSAVFLSSKASAQETGTLIRDKYSLIYYLPEQERTCSDIEYYLDQPTVFSWENLSGSLLSTSQNFIWERYVDREWRSPRTFGDLSTHTISERLSVDLDQDGNDESLVRQWGNYKSQQHNKLSMLDRTDLANPTKSEPLFTRESFQALLDEGGTGLTPEGDFHFFEVMEVMGTPYVVALATIWPGTEHDDRAAFVIQFAEHLEPKLVCSLRTTIFGGGQ